MKNTLNLKPSERGPTNDEIIAEAKRISDLEWEGNEEHADFFGPLLFRLQADTSWFKPEPKPDRAEVLAGEVISAANIVSYDGYYELDEEAVTTTIRRHFDGLRAEWEAERPRVEVPRVPLGVKAWAESMLNKRGAVNASYEKDAARFILSLSQEPSHAD